MPATAAARPIFSPHGLDRQDEQAGAVTYNRDAALAETLQGCTVAG